MPDIHLPHWASGSTSLSEVLFTKDNFLGYTIYLVDISSVSPVYDDILLDVIESDVSILIRLNNFQYQKNMETEAFFTLSPHEFLSNDSYSEDTLRDCQSVGVSEKERADGEICHICGEDITSKQFVYRFTEGEVSSTVHATCWSELLENIEEIIYKHKDVLTLHSI